MRAEQEGRTRAREDRRVVAGEIDMRVEPGRSSAVEEPPPRGEVAFGKARPVDASFGAVRAILRA